MSSFGDTELSTPLEKGGTTGPWRLFIHFLGFFMGRWGSGSRMSLGSPSALETRKESWGVMDVGQSTQQYLPRSTHVPKAAWLSANTCPLLSVCPLAGIYVLPSWHGVLWEAILQNPLSLKFQGTHCWPYTIWPVRKHHFIPQPQTVLLIKVQRCSLFNIVFKSMYFQIPD